VYAHLLEQRNVPASAVAKFYKQVINLSCGFIGSNLAKFVTPALCMWSVVTDNTENPGDDRTPGVAKRKQPWWTRTERDRERARVMFEHHSGLLSHGWASIPTRKRTDKLAGTHASEQLLHFKKPRDTNP